MKMSLLGRWTTVIGVILCACGCGTSPPVRYYGLEPLPTDTFTVKESVVVGIGPLRVPEYMTRPQIVTRGRGGTQMMIDDFNRWAEPLDEAIHRVVAANVDSLVSDVTVVAFPYSNLIGVNYRLVGSVDRFDVDTDGRAVLIVQWGVGDSEHVAHIAPRRSRYEAQAGSTGTDAIVRAMNDTINQFSREIASELEASLASD